MGEWDGGLDGGVEDMVAGASVFAVFFGAIVGDRGRAGNEGGNMFNFEGS